MSIIKVTALDRQNQGNVLKLGLLGPVKSCFGNARDRIFPSQNTNILIKLSSFIQLKKNSCASVMCDDDERTIWCGGLHEQVTEDILYELFMQGGPVEKVSIPKDRDGKQKNFGFVTYKHLLSVPYALDLFDGTSLFNRTLNIKSRNNFTENNKRVNSSLMHQSNMQEYKTSSAQSEGELGQQILIGNVAPMTYAPNNVFMLPPGMMCYPSQTSFHQGSKSSSSDYNRGSRHQNRNHPYRDRDRDYYDNRQYTRDNKSHNKHSSHRSHHRHDTGRRKHH